MIGLDGSSRIKEGDDAEIFVDSSKMHLFDPATGENLTLDTSMRRVRAGETSTAAVAEAAEATATPAEQEGASSSRTCDAAARAGLPARAFGSRSRRP